MSEPTEFSRRVREVCAQPMPLPGEGSTALRHARLFAIGEEDLSLAKLAEAHFDAVAILAEAGLEPMPGCVYGVWASEISGQGLRLSRVDEALRVTGAKPFCSGGSRIDRALVTVSEPEPVLVEVDLRRAASACGFDLSRWQTEAFRATETGGVVFENAPAERVVGPSGFYLDRPGFWHGACGPAACWAGGVAGLLPFARASRRDDPHTTAHLAAMESNVWAMGALLEKTGVEIDADPGDRRSAHTRALRLRHMVEELATDTLHRFARAYGPHPLAMDAAMSRRYAEADLFLRQCHGERDLEALGRALRDKAQADGALQRFV